MKIISQRMLNVFVIVFAIAALLSQSIAASDISMTEIPAAATKKGLQGNVTPTGFIAYESPVKLDIVMNITNPTNENLTLVFAEFDGNLWRVITELGDVAAQGNRTFNLTFRFEYTGLTTYTGKYAVIANDMKSYEFTIEEDWQQYVGNMKNLLAYGGFIVAPIIGLILLVILFLVMRTAERSVKICQGEEYTGRSIMSFPRRGSLSERFTVILANPIVWIFVLFLALVLISIITFTTYRGRDMMGVIQIALISFVAAFCLPVLLMVLSWLADYYEREPLRFIVAMFIWGIASAFLAFFINAIVLGAFGASLGTTSVLLLTVFGGLIVSPIVEETIKAIGIWTIAGHREFNSMLDGLLYGFAIGLGFAAVENWFYFISKINPLTVGIETWIMTILYRSLLNTLAHGCFTAFIGAMIGAMKERSEFAGYARLALFPGLLIAIILHIMFNFSAFFDVISVSQYKAASVFFNPLLVIAVVVGFIALYAIGISRTRKLSRSGLESFIEASKR